MKKILVVEDEYEIVELIKELFTEEGFLVDSAEDGLMGLNKFEQSKYDLIISDVMMDRMDGFKFVERVRQTSDIPILMLTALSEEYDEIKGFTLGVNDYVTKPFSMSILLLRAKVLLNKTAEDSTFIDGDLKLDFKSYMAYYKGINADLTLKEFEVLKYLVSNLDRVFSREQIIDAVWGFDYQGDFRNVDTHIKNIRRKIPSDKIKTVKGLGYKYET